MRARALIAVLALAAPAAAAPRFSDLPFGDVGAVPGSAPARIPQSEHAPGFYLQALPAYGGSDQKYVRLTASPGQPQGGDDGDSCFQVLDAARTGGQRASEWPTTCEETPSILAHDPAAQGAAYRGYSIGAVTRAHFERFANAGGKPTLEVATAFVDPQTRGARLLSHASLALALVATGPGNVHVYALRGDRVVQFVVTGAEAPDFPAHTSGAPFIGSLLGAPTTRSFLSRIAKSISRSLNVVTPVGREGGSNVGFLRIALPALPGDGASSTITTRVVLPPKKDDPGAARELRTRQLDVHLSVSQTSSDAQPVLSVGFGWNGRVQIQGF